MEHALPALLIGFLMLVASSLMARNSLQSYELMGQSLRSAQLRSGEQNQSSFAIETASLDGDRDTVSLTLHNKGQTRLDEFDRMDVIVSYHVSGMYLSSWLPYAAGSSVSNSWYVTSIQNDHFEPGLVNPGETAELELELASPVDAGVPVQVVIATDAGVVVSQAVE